MSSNGPEISILPDDPPPPPSPTTPTTSSPLQSPQRTTSHSSNNVAISSVLTHKARGNKLVSTGNFEAASNSYTDALISLPDESYLVPTRLALLTNRALCYLAIKKFEECRADCDAALQLDDKSVKAFYRRAQAYGAMNELKKGIQDLKAVLNLDPKNKAAKRLARSFIERYNTMKEQKIAGTETTKTKTKTKKKETAFLNKKTSGGLGLYDDKLDSGVSEHVR